MADGIRIDTSQLRAMAAELRKTKPKTYKEVQNRLKTAAERVAVEARLIIGYYSASVPPTVRPFARGLTVGVRAGGGKKPLGVLFEGPKDWRHPVFGNRDVWVTQQ